MVGWFRVLGDGEHFSYSLHPQRLFRSSANPSGHLPNPGRLILCSPELPCSPGAGCLIPVAGQLHLMHNDLLPAPHVLFLGSWVFNPFIKNACWMKGFTYKTGQRFRVAKLVLKNVLFLFFFNFYYNCSKRNPCHLILTNVATEADAHTEKHQEN